MRGDFVLLRSAYLCLDCEAIGSNPLGCPRCESRALLPLANVLRQMPASTTTEGKVKNSSCQLSA